MCLSFHYHIITSLKFAIPFENLTFEEEPPPQLHPSSFAFSEGPQT